MVRQARGKSSSGIYHVILRGVNRQNIFEEDRDCKKLLEILKYYKTISKFELYGYCLMDNHIHLLIKETDESISKIIQRISSSYVNWYNQKYERCGHLFQERFKSEAVEYDNYFITVLRYIHQNPVKALIVNKVDEYLWSSYDEYIRQALLIDIDLALDFFSKDRKRAIEIFKEHANEINSDECLEFNGKTNMTDKELMEYLKTLEIPSITRIQSLEKSQRNDVIKRIKKIRGVSVRQLSRILGISKSVIDRV
ncbi:transposase [Alkaliphilus serpentinus]|uniref:Transposase n=1 Tax=Alkaliphilus serpentinus TaxID=1482731 RepID=A0A833MAJ9_9FIRM|nr:transposase [Alkaliphilus serpentinus]